MEETANVLNQQATLSTETSLERFLRDRQMKEVSLELDKNIVEKFLQGKVEVGVIKLSNDSEVERIRNDIDKTQLQSDKDLSRSLFFPTPNIGNTNMPIRSIFFLVVNGGNITVSSDIKSMYDYNRNTDVKLVPAKYPDLFGTNITIRSNYRKDTNEYIYAIPTVRVLLSSLLSSSNVRDNNEKIENLLLQCKLSVSEYDKYYIMNIKKKDATELKGML